MSRRGAEAAEFPRASVCSLRLCVTVPITPDTGEEDCRFSVFTSITSDGDALFQSGLLLSG